MVERSIPAGWFNRYKNKKLLCRNLDCPNYPCHPYQFYCSKKCSDESNEYQLSHYPRKSYSFGEKCMGCGKKESFGLQLELELDHKTPFGFYYVKIVEGYYKRKPKNRKGGDFRRMFMRVLREANRPENLQWLCRLCHTKKTRRDNKKIMDYKNSVGFDDSEKGLVMIDDTVGRHSYKTWGFKNHVYEKHYTYKQSDNIYEFDDGIFLHNKEYFIYCLMFGDPYSDVIINSNDIELLDGIEEWEKSDVYRADLKQTKEELFLFGQKTIMDYFVMK